MRPDLMGPPRLQPQRGKAETLCAQQDAAAGDGGQPIGAHQPAVVAALAVAGKRRVDRNRILAGSAAEQREIGLFRPVAGKPQPAGAVRMLRTNHHPRRIAVKPADRAERPSRHLRKSRAEIGQRIVRMPLGGVAWHSRGRIQDQEIAVLIEDRRFQRPGIGPVSALAVGQAHRNGPARAHRINGADEGSVEGQPALDAPGRAQRRSREPVCSAQEGRKRLLIPFGRHHKTQNRHALPPDSCDPHNAGQRLRQQADCLNDFARPSFDAP